MSDRERLRELINELAIVKGRVTLASGREADYYVDVRRVTLDGQAAPLVGSVMRELVADWDFDAVGGLTMGAENFLQTKTLMIIVMGVVAFAVSTAGGVLLAKLMNKLSPSNPINPLIGSAGVSAVPMAARVSQVVGAQYDKQNFLLMHAMGPNVAGVIPFRNVTTYRKRESLKRLSFLFLKHIKRLLNILKNVLKQVQI